MYKHILIATDGSELAQNAAQQGLELAKHLEAAVTVVTVTSPWPVAEAGGVMVVSPISEYEDAVAEEAGKVLAKAQDAASKLGVACDAVHVPNRYPAEAIVEQANARSCDLIVMGSHGRRGIAKFLLGSQATRVLAYSTIPVLICK